MPDTNDLLVNLILYGALPLWGIAGFMDWCCHRATRIESTSGLRESLLHSLMGVQLGIPILLCLLFEINVLVLAICVVMWLMHEFIAHMDVHLAAPQRHISIWEMHAHNYLATIPLFLLMLILVMNWPVVQQLVSFDFSGGLALQRVSVPHGGASYMPWYLAFMAVVCVVPYIEENARCLLAARRARGNR